MQCSQSALLSKELCAALQKLRAAWVKSQCFFFHPNFPQQNVILCYRIFFLFQVLLLYIKLAISSLLHFFAKLFLFVSFAKLLLHVFNWHPSISYFLPFFLQSCLCVISLFSADTLGHYQTRATQKPCNNHREQNNIMIESKAYEPDNEPTLKHNWHVWRKPIVL